MRLSILDQSPVRENGSFQDALRETIALAGEADELGYHRFWVSEHHSASFLAGSAPEVLLGVIGANTNRIRLGSGGVMLPHYSAFKVAEIFSVLTSLYPERVDLGVGRAPGTDMETARALARTGVPDFSGFPRQVQELRQRLSDSAMRPRLTPNPIGELPIWMLGTSPDSARLAAQEGLPYNFARFINNAAGPELFDLYRREFVPSPCLAEPVAILTLDVIVASSQEEALRRSLPWQAAWAQMMRGRRDVSLLSIEQAEQFDFTREERRLLDFKIEVSAVGTPDFVQNKLTAIAADFGVDEIMAVTITHDFADRLDSYRLLAGQFHQVAT